MQPNLATHSRRDFLIGGSRLSAIAGASTALAPFVAPSNAASQEMGDYRALVCIFLNGGYDNWSGIPPFDEFNHAQYGAARPTIALSKSDLQNTVIRTQDPLSDARHALHPQLAPLKEIFDRQDLAIVQNIGALVRPVTKAQFQAGSVPLPPQLFSHNDQSSYVLSNLPEGGSSGWGGRIAETLANLNAVREFTCVDNGDNSVFLYGQALAPYAVGTDGARRLVDGADQIFGASGSADILRAISTYGEGSIFQQDYASLMRRSLGASSLMNQIFSAVPKEFLPELADDSNSLAVQLCSVARAMIGGRSLGMRRQIFYVSLPKWDSHDTGPIELAAKFGELSRGMHAFWSLTKRLGLSEMVTTFTASDFGRTLASNGDGSDHGWGSAQFVMGGSVAGGRVIGQLPQVGLSSPDTVLSGRLIPTTSYDQLAATLAKWMGVPTTELTRIAPNLVNFDPRIWDLGLFSDATQVR